MQKKDSNLKIECQYRAFELGASSSEAHSSMGVILEFFGRDWAGAEREFKRAIGLNPNHFDAHFEYGGLLNRLKRLDEVKQNSKKHSRSTRYPTEPILFLELPIGSKAGQKRQKNAIERVKS